MSVYSMLVSSVLLVIFAASSLICIAQSIAGWVERVREMDAREVAVGRSKSHRPQPDQPRQNFTEPSPRGL